MSKRAAALFANKRCASAQRTRTQRTRAQPAKKRAATAARATASVAARRIKGGDRQRSGIHTSTTLKHSPAASLFYRIPTLRAREREPLRRRSLEPVRPSRRRGESFFTDVINIIFINCSNLISNCQLRVITFVRRRKKRCHYNKECSM